MSYTSQDELDAITKEVWGDKNKVWDLTNRGTPLLDYIESEANMPFMGAKEGSFIAISHQIRGNPNSAVPTRAGRGYPGPQGSRFIKSRWNARKLVQSFSIDDESMEFTGGGDQSVVDILTHEMDAEAGQLKNFRKRRNFYAHTDGSALLATCGTTTATNVIQLATTSNMDNFAIDQEVVARAKSGGSSAGTGTLCTGQTAKRAMIITAIDTTNYTITVVQDDGTALSITTASTDGIYMYDAQGYAPTGLGVHCSDSNPSNWGGSNDFYGEVDRSAQPLWRGYRINAASASINLQDHFDPALDQIWRRTGLKQHEISLCAVFGGSQNYNTLKWLLARNRRTVDAGTEKVLKFGHKGLEYEGCHILKDYDPGAPVTAVRIFNPSWIRRYQPRKPTWDKRSGSIWHQQTETGSSRPAGIWRADVTSFEDNIAYSCLAAVEIYGTDATR